MRRYTQKPEKQNAYDYSLESVKHSGSQILHQKKYLYLYHQIMMVNPRTYITRIPPPWSNMGEGGVGPLPRVFNILRYFFKKKLLSVESL